MVGNKIEKKKKKKKDNSVSLLYKQFLLEGVEWRGKKWRNR